MKLDGTIDIAVEPTAVWNLIIDPISLSACVPGVSDVRQVDDQTFEGSISAAVGPVDGTFSFRSVIVRAAFPDDLVVEVEGVDSVTKSRLVANIEVSLAEVSATATTLSYRATVKVKGRLAILGEMMLRATASLMITQLTRCLRSRLEPIGAAPGPQGPATATDTSANGAG
jgi:carbon monoxide dehydrogenase subunit G